MSSFKAPFFAPFLSAFFAPYGVGTVATREPNTSERREGGRKGIRRWKWIILPATDAQEEDFLRD